MKGKKIILSVEDRRWLAKAYPVTKNAELVARLGISESALHRFAREMGLVKSREYMEKKMKTLTDKAHRHNLAHDYAQQRAAGRREDTIRRIAQYRFKPGESCLSRLGEEKERIRVERAAESRRKTFRLEKGRALFGLPRETKLRVLREPRRKTILRHYLKKRGYLIDDQEMIAFWTPDTRRATRLESRPKEFYEFRERRED